MKNWIPYRLGSFLERQYDSIYIDSFTKYKRITIKTKGQGIELRDEVEGVDIRTKNQFQAKHNQFLLSKIDAMNGAFGIVPTECEGGIITGNFWTYELNEEIINREYLQLLCIKQEFTKFCLAASEGTTNRKYLRENKFLNLSISLPPLSEQQRIVLKVEKIKSKIEQILKLRKEQERDLKNLTYSKYFELIKGVEWKPLSGVAPIIRREVAITEDENYPEMGIRSFGKGTFHKPSLTGLEIGTKTLYKIKAGDLMFSNVFAWEGAIAVAKPEDDNRFGSHRFISCVADPQTATPEFLCYHFLTEKGMENINASSPGGAGRNKTLGLEKLMKIKVPVPDITLQAEFVNLLHRVNVIKEQHSQTEKELTELMPALLDKAFKGEI